MSDFIPKWHKELEIFSKIKPLIIVEGNILDVYSYPEEGSIAKGSILRLAAYMHYFFKDLGYQNIVFYDSMQGFYNTAEEGYIERFGQLINQNPSNGRINANFKSNNTVEWVKNALSQSKEATAIIMNLQDIYLLLITWTKARLIVSLHFLLVLLKAKMLKQIMVCLKIF